MGVGRIIIQAVGVAVIYWSCSPVVFPREECSGDVTEIPMSCCPTEMLPFCCVPIVRACNETLQLEMTNALANFSRLTGPIQGRSGPSPYSAANNSSSQNGSPQSSPAAATSPGFPKLVDLSSLAGYAGGEGESKRKPYCVHPMNSSACLPGFFLDTSDNDHAKPCPPGFYCPRDLLCLIPCPEGAYCPTATVVPSTNDSSYQCRQAGRCCEPSGEVPVYDPVESEYICAGSSSPKPCKAGYFCSNVTTRKICRHSYFCREGSTKEEPCPILGHCAEGVSAPTITYAGIALLIVIVLLITIIIISFNYRRTIRFYTQLYASRYLYRDPEARNAFQVDTGLRLAVYGASTLESRAEKIVAKNYTIDITFNDLSLRLKGGSKKSVLAGVTGKINSGEVTAVMGPSGAGKTTFLNTLSGKAYYGVREGEILINGTADDLDMYRTITGFVPQEDVMHRILTVKEILRYQAELRLSSRMKSSEKEKRIHQIIELLELEHIQDSKIGDEETRGISGGQRKRVNIGMELVVDPTLLFLDEPTSGLDSTSSLSVLNALRAVAEKGRLTVVCVIHQPRYEIFRMFHNVLFLGPGGRTVFQGYVDEAAQYFDGLGFEKPLNINPADFYMDVIGGVIIKDNFAPSQLFDEWKTYQTARNGATPVDTANPASTTNGVMVPVEQVTPPRKTMASSKGGIELLSYRGGNETSESSADLIRIGSLSRDFQQRRMPNFLAQFLTFYRREMRLLFRISRSLLIDQCMVLLAGGLLGILNTEVSLRGFFQLQTLSCMAIGLVSMLPALRCFGNYRTAFWRESASGVNRLSYFLAVDFAQVPIMLISPLIYLSLLYTLSIPRGRFIFHYSITVGAWYACGGAAYFMSIIFNPRNAQMGSVLFTLVNSLLAGSSPSLCDLDKLTFIGPALYNLSYARWYLENLFEKEAIRFPRVLSPYVYGAAALNGYSLRDFAFTLSMTFVLGMGFRVMAFALLCLLNRGKQK